MSRLSISTSGQRVTLEAGETATIGRTPEATLQVDDDRVSREHLRIEPDEDGWIICDAGSSNGTFADGERVSRRAIDGAVTLRLGDATRGPWVRISLASELETVDGPAHLRIGRAPDNDLVLDDLLVSRHHAELRPLSDGRTEIVDRGSFNGTYVNGQGIEATALNEGDLVGIGGAQFQFAEGRLRRYVEHGDVAFAAVGLTVRAGEQRLLDEVTFPARQGSLTAVVGPSGAGKSTLLGALTGFRPATEGRVYFGGQDLYRNYADVRQRVGFVPQDDIVHPELTVRQSLDYAAALRFAPDVTDEERRARIDEVLEEMDLAGRRDLPVKKLSGGQRKRVSVALELLTKPALLFLDEPTSGLDPGLERGMMTLLRRLADGGRVIVVVTHSVESLRLCDRVLFLAPGGREAYFAPPQLAMAYFERSDFQEVFQALSDGDPEAWKERFTAHELADGYVRQPLAGHTYSDDGTTRARETVTPPGRQWFRQFGMLTRRTLRVLAADRTNIVTMAGAAPLLGVLALWRLPAGELSSTPPTEIRLLSQASLVLFVVVFSMTLLGLSNGIREISKEMRILQRERAAGLSISAYVGSKAAVLGTITVLQAFVLVPIALARQGGPEDAVLLGWPLGEIMLAAALSGLAALGVGLLVSALARSTPGALALLPLLLVFQVLFGAGGVFPDTAERPLLREISYVSSTGWGFAAAASTADLNELQRVNDVATEVPTIDLTRPEEAVQALTTTDQGKALFDHEPGAWLLAMGAMGAIAVVCFAGTGLALRRVRPL